MSVTALRTGLVSVTFRKLSPMRIVEVAADAGLASIEWGGDVHCPPGDLNAATIAHDLSVAAGLVVSAYGSYYRLGADGNGPAAINAICASAVALHAPVIRIWAGTVSSLATTPVAKARVIDDLTSLCDAAAERGLAISLEYHRDTLTDTPESAVDLLTAANRPNLYTYWQPRHGLTVEQNLTDLSMLRPWLRDVHVFHWWPEASVRHPLNDGADRWHTYLAAIASDGRPHTCSLEFVKDDRLEQLRDDGRVLNDLVRGVQAR